MRIKKLSRSPNIQNKSFFNEVLNDIKKFEKKGKGFDPEYIENRYYIINRLSEFGEIRNFTNNLDEYEFAFDFLSELLNNFEATLKLTYDITYTNKILGIKRVSVYVNNRNAITLNFDTNVANNCRLASISSSFFERDKLSSDTLSKIRDSFNSQSTIFSFVEDEESFKNELKSSILAFTLRFFFNIVNGELLNDFKDGRIYYVSPLRAHPKRYYFLDKAKVNSFVDTFDGDVIAEIIKDNTSLKTQVNNWLKKFGIEVDVKLLQDVIHQLVVNENSLALDITDVGFGISQVLPVIIQGFLSSANSITLIEQPEIHLHPKMQAELADLFIDIVSSNKNSIGTKNLLIETHSEYLLKRLRRRISEGKIKPTDVAIYLINPQTKNESASIKELKIAEKGEFDWPVEFYGGELLKDTTEFIKNQAN